METDEESRHVLPFQLQFDKPLASQAKMAEWNLEKDLLAMVTEDSKWCFIASIASTGESSPFFFLFSFFLIQCVRFFNDGLVKMSKQLGHRKCQRWLRFFKCTCCGFNQGCLSFDGCMLRRTC